ncbi:hypothetical protein D6779_10110 [Candidatus Parcubacteria bacterium]|nr:MAG: hypothetical protein D6779_10110 [Candidatus Parcubacteria bacterium]
MAFDWKGIVASVAPMIGTALGGPFGGLAAKAALSALGIEAKEGSEEQQLAEAVKQASPEQLLALKKADQDFAKAMKSLDVDLEKIASADRASARQREISLRDNAPKILATVVVAGFFSTLYVIAFVPLPEGAQQPVNILLGALTAMLTQVGNYYFGSSRGSDHKTEILRTVLK